jgi:prevent-host-death family protein
MCPGAGDAATSAGLTNLTNTDGMNSVFGMRSVNLYEAKTHLSTLVEEASKGEKIVIAKNGEPRAMLVPLPTTRRERKPARALKISYIAPDFDAPDPEIAALFGTES